ncbi:MAG: glycosyl transferase, partial [Gemmatimonadota bacterium]|nr:glycosyl transferase [Gemmatimonadota bacterium]
AVGFADDRKTVAVLTRLASHFAAAALAIAFIGIAPVARELHLTAAFQFLAPVLCALYLVWMLNLTNFMDGIDGLAGLEVITVCVGGVLSALLCKYRIGTPFMTPFTEANSAISAALFAPLLLAAATAGFLFWNWAPAKIFMGDAGSGFLGITLGALSIIAAVAAPQLLWSWLILLGVFTVDATVTLFRRVVRRETFYKAHRSHAYQHAARRWGHQRTTLAVGAINVAWLIPLALAVATTRLDAFTALAIAYVPLAGLAFFLNAGVPD